MKKNLQIALLSAFLISGANLIAQNVNNSGSALITKSSMGAKPVGSQYFDDNFMPANIKDMGITMIKYNAYLDQIELKSAVDQTSVLNVEEGRVIATTNGKNAFEFVTYVTDENETVKGYLNLISNNSQVKIYERLRIFLQPETDTKSGYEAYKPPMYKKASTKYFIKIKDNKIVQFNKKKELFELFPGKEKQINEYIKSNKISFSDVADLSKLGTYLDTLAG